MAGGEVSGKTEFSVSYLTNDNETLTIPRNPAVLAYLKAAKEGKGLVQKILKGLKSNKK